MITIIFLLILINIHIINCNTTNNPTKGLLLGKDRELFHVAVDLKWFFGKLKSITSWKNATLISFHFLGGLPFLVP